jgi:hypothetical protein
MKERRMHQKLPSSVFKIGRPTNNFEIISSSGGSETATRSLLLYVWYDIFFVV